jgi:glycosyltransferase involved in cell wall biosynthesis
MADVTVWSEGTPDSRLAALMPIRQIVPRRGIFPRRGTLVFIGGFYFPGRWTVFTWPQRLVVVHNTMDGSVLQDTIRRLSWRGRRRVEVAYASSQLRACTGFDGVLQPSLIDLNEFKPAQSGAERPFTVGRLSRDILDKHHPDDPALYRRLVAAGIRVRLMGATCLASQLPVGCGVDLLPACSVPAHEFLQSLDCFLYRTGDGFTETYGRVVLEAMACGLPVVCHRRGGYAEYIEEGRSGLLFDWDEEALAAVMRLRDEPTYRATVGGLARCRAKALITRGVDVVRQYYVPGSHNRAANRPAAWAS